MERRRGRALPLPQSVQEQDSTGRTVRLLPRRLEKAGPAWAGRVFGRGKIGKITIDPATVGQSRPSWFCTIEDYEPFNPPVPAKPDGVFYETIPQNMWRNGVRSIDQATFDRIIGAAGATVISASASPRSPRGVLLETDDLIIPKGKMLGGGKAGGVGYRRSKRAKEIGDWAEQLVVEFLQNHGDCAEIVHRAAIAETPGWDIDYRDANGVLHRIEVKGTVGGAFSTIDLTANELRAAQQHGPEYWLFLVANCLTGHPKIQRICAPGEKLAAGAWTATPALYSVSLS